MTKVVVRHKIVNDGDEIDIPQQTAEHTVHVDEEGRVHVVWLESNLYY